MPSPRFVTLNPGEVVSVDIEPGAASVKVTTCGAKTEAPVYFTTDGTEPAAGGRCTVLVAGRPVYETVPIAPSSSATVKLVSAAVAKVKIEAG